MLEELVFGFWFALGVYVFWYVVKAKDFQPLTLDDLALTWKLHKHQSGCKSSCIHDLLVRNNEVVGFKCECGHESLQKRLITQRAKIATHMADCSHSKIRVAQWRIWASLTCISRKSNDTSPFPIFCS